MAQKKKGPGRPPGSKNNTKKSNVSPDVRKNVQKLEMRRENKAQIKDEILGIIVVALGVFLVIALQTHAAGVVGESISKALKGMFGFVAFLLPYYFILYGVMLFLKKTIHIGIKSVVFLLVIYLGISLLNSGRFMEHIANGESWGGFTKCFNDGVALNGGGVFGMGDRKSVV